MANVVMINKTLIELNYFIFPTRGERVSVHTKEHKTEGSLSTITARYCFEINDDHDQINKYKNM
jgi:hypothetical protein